ncbi:MAG: hypothetical protein V4505_17725 [Pseudomonadota bacterium]
MKHAAAIFLLAAAGAVACGAAQAQELAPPPVVDPIAPDVAAARSKDIDRDRAVLQKAQLVEERACYQKFAVNGCLLDTRARYRPKLAELRHRELAVRAGERRRVEDERQVRMAEQQKNDEANKARAIERAATTVPQAQRQAELQQRQAERTAAQPAQAQRAQSQQTQAQEAHTKEAASVARRAAEAPEQRSRYAAKQKAAEERRAAQARRAQDKAAKPASQPLPDPPAR